MLVGLPTGFSAAYRPADSPLFFDAAVAWSFQDSAVVHADVCLTLSELRSEDLPEFVFPVWVGVGPRTHFGTTDTVLPFEAGIRIPVGMAMYHERVPLEAFVELVPVVGVIPSTVFRFDAAVGARFYFDLGIKKGEKAPASSP